MAAEFVPEGKRSEGEEGERGGEEREGEEGERGGEEREGEEGERGGSQREGRGGERRGGERRGGERRGGEGRRRGVERKGVERRGGEKRGGDKRQEQQEGVSSLSLERMDEWPELPRGSTGANFSCALRDGGEKKGAERGGRVFEVDTRGSFFLLSQIPIDATTKHL
eukprot:710739-Hanusia_phi.AAC.1